MATSPRSLRIGILLAGHLVDERVLDGAAPITFGQSLRCTLSVPIEGLPREHVLFTYADGRFELHEPAGMMVHRADGRGRLTLGDVTILFQEVTATPAAPRPQLPAAMRTTLADRIDRRVALFVGGSLLVHIGIAAYAWTADVPTTPLGLSPVATTYHQDVIDVTVPDAIDLTPSLDPDDAAKPAAATQPATPRQTQTPRPIVRPTSHTTSRPTPVQRPASGDDAQRLASILTGADETPRGTGGMRARQPGADLNQQIDDARNRTITIGDGTHTSRTDDRARIGTTPDHPLVADQALTHTDRPSEDTLRGRIQIGPVKPDDTTTLTPAVVLDRINTVYMAGLQRCYKNGLKLDSTLSGRVAMSFTVDPRGRLSDASASGVSSGVDGCIERQMANWRFPIPKDPDGGDPTDASFAVSLALQPS